MRQVEPFSLTMKETLVDKQNHTGGKIYKKKTKLYLRTQERWKDFDACGINFTWTYGILGK